MRNSAEHLHIIEDDTILAHDARQMFDKMLENADAHPDGWDLIFTDILVPIDRVDFVHLLAKHIAAFRQSGSRAILDLAGIPFSCTSSFFVNRQSIDKYAGLIADQWTWGKPIDLFLRRLINQGRLKAFVTVPFMTSISEISQQSDIADVTSRSVAVGSAPTRNVRRGRFRHRRGGDRSTDLGNRRRVAFDQDLFEDAAFSPERSDGRSFEIRAVATTLTRNASRRRSIPPQRHLVFVRAVARLAPFAVELAGTQLPDALPLAGIGR